MDLAFYSLLSLHLAAFAVGLSMNVAMPLIGRLMATGGAPVAALTGPAMKNMRAIGPAAFLVLIASGFGMVQLRYGGDFTALGTVFTVKMALVLLLVGLVFFGRVLMRGIDPRLTPWIPRAVLAGIVVCSVVAFN